MKYAKCWRGNGEDIDPTNEFEACFVDNENVLKLIVVILVQLCEYCKHQRMVYFKWINFMLCEFFLNTAINTNSCTLKYIFTAIIFFNA